MKLVIHTVFFILVYGSKISFFQNIKQEHE